MYSLVLMAALSTGAANVPACHSCCGCYGGWSCCGCYGGWSCCGCYGGWDCCGCYGGWGCYGYDCCGCYGGWGCYGCYGYASCYGCYGCYGGYAPAYYAPPAGAPMPGAGTGETVPAPKKKEGAALSTKAKLVVDVPADAKLYVDDQLMKTPAGHRVFNTPALERGQAYYYVVRVEVQRDGKLLTDTKRVIVRAGEETRADFRTLETASTARATASLGR